MSWTEDVVRLLKQQELEMGECENHQLHLKIFVLLSDY